MKSRSGAWYAREHYRASRAHHALLSIARLHLGPDLTSSELEGNAAAGSFAFDVEGGRILSAWSSAGVLAAHVGSDVPVVVARDLPRAIAESVRNLLASESARGLPLLAVRWVDERGEPGHSVGGHALSLGAEAPPIYSYVAAGQRNRLSVRHAHVAGSFTFVDHVRSISAAEVAEILSDPYFGSRARLDPEDVESAVGRLRTLGIEWPEWRADIERPSQSAPRRGAPSPAARLASAIIHDDPVGMELAIASGADVRAPLTEAALRSPHVPRMFSKAFASIVPVLLAFRLKRDHLVGWLIDRGVDVNAELHEGTTLLSHAVATKRPALCVELLKRGADPLRGTRARDLLRDAIGGAGTTSAPKVNLEMLRILLDAGARIDPTPPRPGVMPLRAQLARFARQQGDEALAVRIESTPVG